MTETRTDLAMKPAPAPELAARLIGQAPALLAALGAPGAVAPALASSRAWSPLDGAEAPWCPYVDLWRATLTHGGWTVRVQADVACWNEQEVRNASVGVAVLQGDALIAHVYGVAENAALIDRVRVLLEAGPDRPDRPDRPDPLDPAVAACIDGWLRATLAA